VRNSGKFLSLEAGPGGAKALIRSDDSGVIAGIPNVQ
jgi:hypothetical protein